MEFLYPTRLWLIPIGILILFLLTAKTFVPIREPNPNLLKRAKRRRMAARILMLISRSVIIVAIAIALASPSLEISHRQAGTPGLTIMVDHSRSMEVFDTSFVAGLAQRIGQDAPVSVVDIGRGEHAQVGSEILANLGQNRNVLLVTDGYTPYGADFADVMTYAAALNTTVNALDISPLRDEAAVSVEGPSKVVEGTDTPFTINIERARPMPVHVQVSVDGNVLLDKDTESPDLSFSDSFTPGTHIIHAQLTADDHFTDNNAFDKVVRVIEKPAILFIGKGSPLKTTLDELYQATTVTNLPSDLSPYYAVVLDDVGTIETDNLGNFLDDGNGLVAFGGKNSFEYAPGSQLTTLLPVIPGKGELKAKPDLNAVVLVDISSADQRAVSKAYAIDVLDKFKQNDNVGVIAFAQESFVVSEMSRIFQKDLPTLKDQLGKLGYKCSVNNRYVCSRFDLGFDLAIKQLSGVSGRKYIFLLSDGMFGPENRDPSWSMTDELKRNNIQVIPVITIPITDSDLAKFGSVDDVVLWRSGYEFMTTIASRTASDEYGGTVIKPTARALPQIAIITGQRQEEAQKGGTDLGLFIFDSAHFITRDLSLTAKLFGTNQVVPKSTGKLLVSTADGSPVLIVGYYGLGRVAAVATDDGESWSPEMFAAKENSELISRTINWAIGDPERKRDSYVIIPDGRIGQQEKIAVKASAIPSLSGVNFESTGDVFEGTFTPTATGIQELLGTKFAVNYDPEISAFGLRPDMQDLVSKTGGKLFKADKPGEIVSYLMSQADRRVTEKTVLRWPLVALALAVLVIEIIVRRILENRNA